ncbi:hypothetical protein LP414_07615 [Polaromonas sp. P1(28)-13]|nr:hypothetical protein LP414_07615 [Polaromonas sp. P1(28)-13]
MLQRRRTVFAGDPVASGAARSAGLAGDDHCDRYQRAFCTRPPQVSTASGRSCNAPAGLKERYFKRTADGRYAIVPQIRKMVNFAHLNLAQDVYPSLATDTNAMDLIFCRNVLMYFTPLQTRTVIGKLHHALVAGGWLVVSPSEASHALSPQFVAVNFPGAILYQRWPATPRTEQRWAPEPRGEMADDVAPASEAVLPWASSHAAAAPSEPPPDALPEQPAPVETPLTPSAVAESFYQQGRYAEVVDTLLAGVAEHAPGPLAFSLLTRALANLGRLADALTWCDRWIAADKLDPATHYLRAVVLLEQGDFEQRAPRSSGRSISNPTLCWPILRLAISHAGAERTVNRVNISPTRCSCCGVAKQAIFCPNRTGSPQDGSLKPLHQ